MEAEKQPINAVGKFILEILNTDDEVINRSVMENPILSISKGFSISFQNNWLYDEFINPSLGEPFPEDIKPDHII